MSNSAPAATMTIHITWYEGEIDAVWAETAGGFSKSDTLDFFREVNDHVHAEVERAYGKRFPFQTPGPWQVLKDGSLSIYG